MLVTSKENKNSFINTLELENYINQLRIQYAKAYLGNKADLRIITDEDCLAIYACLTIKDQEAKKKVLDKVKEM